MKMSKWQIDNKNVEFEKTASLSFFIFFSIFTKFCHILGTKPNQVNVRLEICWICVEKSPSPRKGSRYFQKKGETNWKIGNAELSSKEFYFQLIVEFQLLNTDRGKAEWDSQGYMRQSRVWYTSASSKVVIGHSPIELVLYPHYIWQPYAINTRLNIILDRFGWIYVELVLLYSQRAISWSRHTLRGWKTWRRWNRGGSQMAFDNTGSHPSPSPRSPSSRKRRRCWLSSCSLRVAGHLERSSRRIVSVDLLVLKIGKNPFQLRNFNSTERLLYASVCKEWRKCAMEIV